MARGHVFDDPKKLQRLFERYRAGTTLLQLGREFKTDHTSCLYQLRKHGLWQPAVPKPRTPSIPTSDDPKPDRRAKLTQEMLSEIFILYLEGASPKQIAPLYDVDPVAIYHHLKSHGLFLARVRPTTYKQGKLLTPFSPQHKYAYVFDEPMNPGKTYREYLEDDARRHNWRPYNPDVEADREAA